MNPLLREILEKLMSLTHEAEASCLAEDWERLERLQQERLTCLTQLHAELKEYPPQGADQAQLQRILLDLQAAEQRMAAKAALHRQHLFNENEQLQKGKQMTKAYKA